MERIFTFTIVDADCGLTIYEFLRKNKFSRQTIIFLKKSPESILLNGVWAYVNEKLISGDCLTVCLKEEENSANIPPIRLPLDIVYEDADILVVNKPAGMPTHPSMNHHDDTLANGVAYYYKEKGLPYVFRCVNRLDRDTSGLTVLAKNRLASGILSTMAANREITREYLALVRTGSTPLASSGTIAAPIARTSQSLITRCVDYEKGEHAVTHYKVLERKNGYDLISLQLETGRTHQIRVHMKYLGHPLLGDFLYGGDMTLLSRQALHSYRLSFCHPITDMPLSFCVLPPADMQQLI